MVTKVTVDIDRAIRASQRRVDTFMSEFLQDVSERVVRRTPVDTGFLRGSWFPRLNGSPATYEGASDRTGATTIGRVAVATATARPGDTYEMVNQANYADFVENGTSRMAGRHFVKGTMAEASSIAIRTAARIRPKRI